MPRILDRGRLLAALKTVDDRLSPEVAGDKRRHKLLLGLMEDGLLLSAVATEVNMSYEKGKETSD